VALIGWLFVYIATGRFFIVLGATTLAVGLGVFILWAMQTDQWPFAARRPPPAGIRN
jgi:hypothetical protein